MRVLVVLLAGLLAGCALPPLADIEMMNRMGLAAEPSYAQGDMYLFSNPETAWRVIGVGPDLVNWQDNRGNQVITTMNPFLPPVKWQGPDVGQAAGAVQNLEGYLFPLMIGKRMSFTTAGTGPAGGWRQHWNCAVAGAEQVSLALGTFDTYRIQCTHRDTIEVYLYAPRVGYFVVKERYAPWTPPLRRELIAYQKADGRRTGRFVRPVGPPLTRTPPPAAPATEMTPPPGPPSLPPRPASGPPTDLSAGAPASPRTAAPASAPAAATGPHGIFLATYADAEAAARAWAALRDDHGDLANHGHRVVAGAEGHRLEAGPMSRLEAMAVCNRLLVADQRCEVMLWTE